LSSSIPAIPLKPHKCHAAYSQQRHSDAFLITTIIMVTKKDDNNAFNYDAKILAVNKQNISHVTGY